MTAPITRQRTCVVPCVSKPANQYRIILLQEELSCHSAPQEQLGLVNCDQNTVSDLCESRVPERHHDMGWPCATIIGDSADKLLTHEKDKCLQKINQPLYSGKRCNAKNLLIRGTGKLDQKEW